MDTKASCHKDVLGPPQAGDTPHPHMDTQPPNRLTRARGFGVACHHRGPHRSCDGRAGGWAGGGMRVMVFLRIAGGGEAEAPCTTRGFQTLARTLGLTQVPGGEAS